jgi:phospholipid transport system transporter-binding protein
MSIPAEERQKAQVGISEPRSGRVLVSGELTFATAREARQAGMLVLEGSSADRIVIDCAAVTRADSAGLAVLLDWLAWGRRKARPIELQNLPASLVAIARISEVDGMLGATS